VQTETATQTLLPEDLVQQFAVMLHNRSGAMGSLLKLLKSAHIETLGFSAQDSQDLTILRLVTSDPEETRSLFLEKGIPHTMSELLVVAFRNPDDELPKFLQALLAAETNINFTYSLLPHPEGKTLVAFHVEDAYFASTVLIQSGFQICRQKDLSR